jgi:ParB family chromosome partitioning protein
METVRKNNTLYKGAIMRTNDGAIEQRYAEVLLADITLNTYNARRKVKMSNLDELVVSIKNKGLIHPVLLREVENGDGETKLELVSGARRYYAARIAATQLGVEDPTIPTVIRNLDDDEAFEIMLMENLQRRDLTPLEEALSFARYIKRHGDAGVEVLASRAAINPQYIRRRIAILELPKYVLQAWDDGFIAFASLEQLLRLDLHDVENLWAERIAPTIDRGERVPKSEIMAMIQRIMLNLGAARFNVDEACVGCRRNTAVQMELFGMQGPDKIQCLDAECFKALQMAHLEKYWKQTKAYREFHTARPVFGDDYGYGRSDIEHIWKPSEECLDCNDFVSTVRMDGIVLSDTACIGDEECFARVYPKGSTNTGSQKVVDPKSSEEKAAVKAHNRGVLFREAFFKEHLADRIREVKPDDARCLQLAAFLLQQGHTECSRYMSYRLGDIDEEELAAEGWFTSGGDEVLGKLDTWKSSELLELLRDYAVEVLMTTRVSHGVRCDVATMFGIDLSEEFRIDSAYLEKRTKADILALAEEWGWNDSSEFVDYLSRHYGTPFGDLKKSQMIKCVTESGMDLTGQVPREIITID